MTTPTRCDWSDLPTGQCAHCTGDVETTRLPDLQPPQARATRPATPAAHPRRLPILGAALEHGQQPDIHDMVDELTRAHGHRERYTSRRGTETWAGQHITDVPALVHQLLGAHPAASQVESGSGPVSKPAARIEAIDTLMLIDTEASAWVRRLGENDPGDTYRNGSPVPGSGTIACLRRVHALHASARPCHRPRGHRERGVWCCTAHHIEHDVRRWWHQARIISGWDSPAYRPHNTCPVCEHRGGLRINLAQHAGFCVECREVWSSETIGLLAEHVRAENAEDGEPVEHDEMAG